MVVGPRSCDHWHFPFKLNCLERYKIKTSHLCKGVALEFPNEYNKVLFSSCFILFLGILLILDENQYTAEVQNPSTRLSSVIMNNVPGDALRPYPPDLFALCNGLVYKSISEVSTFGDGANEIKIVLMPSTTVLLFFFVIIK